MISLNRSKNALEAMGLNVTVGTDESGLEALNASIKTKRGTFTVFAIAEGARLGKPNGTTKFMYGCSDAQLSAAVRQTIKANN